MQQREGAGLRPYPAKKRMLLHDVPKKVKEEGKEIMAIPAMLDKQIGEIIQQRKRDIHEEDTRNGNVQILESMLGECKNQLATVEEEGGGRWWWGVPAAMRYSRTAGEGRRKVAGICEDSVGYNSRANS